MGVLLLKIEEIMYSVMRSVLLLSKCLALGGCLLSEWSGSQDNRCSPVSDV